MKKLTKDEAEAIITKPVGPVSAVGAMILSLKVEEYLLVEKKDWHSKSSTPSVLCRRIEKRTPGYKFECRRALDGSGWVIKREK